MQYAWVYYPVPCVWMPPPPPPSYAPLRTASSPCRLENTVVSWYQGVQDEEYEPKVEYKEKVAIDNERKDEIKNERKVEYKEKVTNENEQKVENKNEQKVENEIENDQKVENEIENEQKEAYKAEQQWEQNMEKLEETLCLVLQRMHSSRAVRRHLAQKQQRKTAQVMQEKEDMEAMFQASVQKAYDLESQLHTTHAQLLRERAKLLETEKLQQVHAENNILRTMICAQKIEIKGLKVLCDQRASQADMERQMREKEVQNFKTKLDRMNKLCNRLLRNQNKAEQTKEPMAETKTKQ